MKKKRLYNGITYLFKKCFCSNILIWLSLIWVAAFLCCFFCKLNGIHNKNGLFLIWCKLVKFTFTFLRKFRLCWLYKIKVSRCSCIFSFVWNFKSAIKSVSFLEKPEFRFVSEQKGQFSSSVTTAGIRRKLSRNPHRKEPTILAFPAFHILCCVSFCQLFKWMVSESSGATDVFGLKGLIERRCSGS